MRKWVRFHDFEKILIASIKRHMKFSVMHDCVFGHYLVTLVLTYNQAVFEVVWACFPTRLPGPMLYVSLCIISF